MKLGIQVKMVSANAGTPRPNLRWFLGCLVSWVLAIFVSWCLRFLGGMEGEEERRGTKEGRKMRKEEVERSKEGRRGRKERKKESEGGK